MNRQKLEGMLVFMMFHCSNYYNTVHSMLSITSILIPFTCQSVKHHSSILNWKNRLGAMGTGS